MSGVEPPGQIEPMGGTGMTESRFVLDEAFERMAGSDFELPNGFVNHGPMACEALDAMGLDDQIGAWSRRFVRMVGDGPRPEAPQGFAGSGWQGAVGEYRRLPEWIGYFDGAIAESGWQRVVRVWVPRLVPGLGAALFHGVIRTGHAVRALSTADSPARQAELARSLAYWAARFTPGQPVPPVTSPTDDHDGVLAAAAHGARYFVDRPSIVNLHGVTGAMAVGLLLGHLDPEAAMAAVAQVRAEHGALYSGPVPDTATGGPGGWDGHLFSVAAQSRDAHQVKLVEACWRAFSEAGEPIFLVAAQGVTGLTRRPTGQATTGSGR